MMTGMGEKKKKTITMLPIWCNTVSQANEGRFISWFPMLFFIKTVEPLGLVCRRLGLQFDYTSMISKFTASGTTECCKYSCIFFWPKLHLGKAARGVTWFRDFNAWCCRIESFGVGFFFISFPLKKFDYNIL